MVDQSELASEQRLFDEAADHRERTRQLLGRSAEAAAHPGSAARIRQTSREIVAQLRGPDEAVAFGRIDLENEERRYIGYDLIHNEKHDPLVISWKAKAAAPFYEARPGESLGVIRKREYETERNRIRDFQDTIFEQVLKEIERLEEPDHPQLTDVLLTDLSRHRIGEMRDIARTIQAAQYQIIRQPLDQLLIVEGGPGTGKTAVALHRVSWLLYNHDELSVNDILIVGPNPTFIRYVEKVLPSLGDERIRHSSIGGLFPGIRPRRAEPDEAVRIKGELRIRTLLTRALGARVHPPTEPIEIRSGARTVRIRPEALTEEMAGASGLPYATGRQRIRDFLRTTVRQETGLDPGERELETPLDRVWPQLTPQAFLRDLLGSKERLLNAGGSEFSAEEINVLYRKAAERLSQEAWSQPDIPLLDYADYLINGPLEDTYRHIVVDEAQDLSPMELRMIARRSSTGSITVLGDLAQSTGIWARDTWDDILQSLGRARVPSSIEHLEYGYRVPKEIFDYAAQLLPIAAPGLRAPKAIREGHDEPEVRQTEPEELAPTVLASAQAYGSRGLSVAVICPSTRREEILDIFSADRTEIADAAEQGLGAPITLVAPWACKGLEFDAVIVVEPSEIADEAHRGERLAYVALTRATRSLSVIHTGSELPLGRKRKVAPASAKADAVELQMEPAEPPEGADVGLDLADAIAERIAREIRSSLTSHAWPRVLERLQEILENPRADQ